MNLFESLMRLCCRFRYPVSLPEDVANDLGMKLPNTLSFKEFLHLLSSPHHHPTRIKKFMKREQAEKVFELALKREKFKSSSLFSYYFNKNWLVITLYFDEEDRLRRLYLQCPACEQLDGFDIPLDEEYYATASSH